MLDRAAGILLHPTSLPSLGGIGDLGPAAHDFVEFLTAARQRLWQVLPLGPVGVGNSPYSSSSAFAGNPLLVSLERLAERGWIERSHLFGLSDAPGRIDYERVKQTKMPLLREAAVGFLQNAAAQDRGRFEHFCRENGWWLDDFVLFDELRARYDGLTWNAWPAELARRDPAALDRLRREAEENLAICRVIQFAVFEQWRALRARCAHYGIRIVGDVAIFVNYDSADVWTHPGIFRLNENLDPETVAGVPPDAFSVTGQRWGNPLYNWEALRQRDYDWWKQRMHWALAACDLVRLDHFRGFEACWEIPATEPTAVHGSWTNGPGDALFEALRRELGGLPFIAEDLGFITPEVHALRERLGIPGMRVMQFGFGNPGAHIYLPHRFDPNTVVYTGTHDNDTTLGWWRNQATDDERRFAASYLGADEHNASWAFLRGAMDSVARYAIAPLQDVLGLGSEARMNVPSRSEENWEWRFLPGATTGEIAIALSVMVDVTDRDPIPFAQDREPYREKAADFAA
ncbi:MAG: 4-alpha-glucanotransferase [Terriglobales bacterium]|jgi:4-alpha-glucanotransferase